jgi:hypothetical protein
MGWGKRRELLRHIRVNGSSVVAPPHPIWPHKEGEERRSQLIEPSPRQRTHADNLAGRGTPPQRGQRGAGALEQVKLVCDDEGGKAIQRLAVLPDLVMQGSELVPRARFRGACVQGQGPVCRGKSLCAGARACVKGQGSVCRGRGLCARLTQHPNVPCTAQWLQA